jgi:hypothetical protein
MGISRRMRLDVRTGEENVNERRVHGEPFPQCPTARHGAPSTTRRSGRRSTRCVLREKRRTHSSVVVTVGREDEGDGVEVAYRTANKSPATALLSKMEARELRDYLDGALEVLHAN